jgi:antitoxin component of RelBE/YafQ-DinJ toxin-antitoxin module
MPPWCITTTIARKFEGTLPKAKRL